MLGLLLALSLAILQIKANTYVTQIGKNIEIETVFTRGTRFINIVIPNKTALCILTEGKVIFGDSSCEITGEKQITIKLTNLTEESAGSYWFAEGSVRNRVSEAFLLYILDKPTIVQNESVVVNRPLVLRCQLNIKPSLDRRNNSVQTFWTRNTKPLPDNVEIQDSVLTIKRYKWKRRSAFVCVTMVNGVNSTESEKLWVDAERGPDESRLVPNLSRYTRREGDSLNVTCSSVCVPECTVIWTHDKKTVSTTSLLDIGHLGRDDTGNYTCIVTNTHGRKELNVGVTVQYGPSVLRLDRPSSPPLVGTSVILRCTADCEPRCDVIWSKTGGKKTRSQVLTIASVKKEDAGTYTCSASNKHGRQDQNLELMVSYPPEVTLLASPGKTVEGGTDVTLTCTGDSSPTPNITWSKNKKPIKWDPGPTVKTTLYTAALVLRDAQCEDTGSYSCDSTNTYGSNSSGILINVTCPPTSLSTWTNHIFYQRLHSAQTYYYDIKGNPEPRVVNWTHTTEDGTVVSVLKDMNYEEDIEPTTRPFYSLKLIHMNVQYSSSGQYSVSLWNGVGTYTLRYFLLVQDKPGRPRNVTILNSTQTSISLSFLKSFHGNAEQYFQVEIPGQLPQNLTVTCDDEDDNPDDDGDGDDGDAVVNASCIAYLIDLKPGTSYFIKLRAVNQIGASDFSHPIRCDTKKGPGRWKLGKVFTLLGVVLGVIVVCAFLAGLVYLLTCRPCRHRQVEMRKLRVTTASSSEATEETQADLWETIAADQEPMFPAIENGSDARMSEYRISKMCVETVTFTSASPGENADGCYVNLPFQGAPEPRYTRYVCDGNSGFDY